MSCLLNPIQQSFEGRILLFLLFFVSFSGFVLFFRKRGVQWTIAPGLTVAGIMCVEFMAGILNVLSTITQVIFISGVVLFFFFAVQLFRNKGQLLQLTHIYPYIFIILISAFAAYRFRNVYLYGYDDFSHWGTIVRCMLLNDRLPNFSDTFITFQSYPPATGLFIYYFIKIVGSGESGMLFAQYFVKICFLSSLLFISENFNTKVAKIISTVIVSTCVVLLSIYNVSSLSLSVDTVLGCCGIFCIAVIFINKERMDSIGYVPAVCVTACVLIKNSGIFFYFTSVVFILFLAMKQHRIRAYVKPFLWMLVPIAAIIIWQRHVALVFPAGLNAKHTMTLSHATDIFLEKTHEEIIEELSVIGSCIINPLKNRTLFIWGGLVVYTFILVPMYNHQRRHHILGILCIFLIYSLVYELGIMCMYLCSMPHDELLWQNGSDYLRYNGTLDLFLAAFSLAYVSLTLYRIRNQMLSICGIIAVTILIIFALCPRTHLEDLNPNEKANLAYKDKVEVKQEIQSMLTKLKDKPEGQILVRVKRSVNTAGYIHYLMIYLTQSTNHTTSDQPDNTVFDTFWKEEANQPYCLDLISHQLRIR